MEKYIQHIELINDYLNNLLSEEARLTVASRLETDTEFRALYTDQIVLVEGIKRYALKQEIASAQQSYVRTKRLKNAGYSLLGISIVLLAYLWFFNNSKTEIIPTSNPQNTNIMSLDTTGVETISNPTTVIEDSLIISSKKIRKERVLTSDLIEIKETSKTKLNIESVLKVPGEPSIIIGENHLKALYKSLLKRPQLFRINTAKDTTLMCREGTVLKIKADAFVYPNAEKRVEGSIDFEVTEYYKMSDIIVANLTTMSNHKLLETGGMLNIEASKGDLKLGLDANKGIDISFPTTAKKEGMKLFYGESLTDDLLGDEVPRGINWNLATNEKKEFVFSKVTYDTIFNYQRSMNTDIRNMMRDDALVVDKAFWKAFNTYKKQRLIRTVFFNSKNYIFLRKSLFEAENSKYKIFETDSISRGGHIIREISPESFLATRSVLKPVYDFRLRARRNDNYGLLTSNLGWVNCDRFINFSAEKIEFTTDIRYAENMDVKLIFNDMGSIMPAEVKNGVYVFSGVPLDQKVSIVAISCEKDSFEIALQETRISKKGLRNLIFEIVTLSGLKRKLEVLNK